MSSTENEQSPIISWTSVRRTPAAFVNYLQGFLDSAGDQLSPDQLVKLKEQLNSVQLD